MAYIQKRVSADGSNSYRVQIRLKGCPLESATFDRMTDAREWAAKTEADMKAGRHFGVAKRHTFGELIDLYTDWKAGRIKCFDERKPVLARWLELLGDCQLDAITPAKLASCRDALARETVRRGARPGKIKSGGTVNRMMAYLSDLLGYAVKELQWIERNPCERISKFKEAPGRVRFLSDDERDALLTACQQSTNPDLYAAVVLSLTTGARQSEIMNLTWPQIDFENRRITLLDGETKNDEGRVLPLVGKAFDLLKERSNARSKVRLIDTPLAQKATESLKSRSKVRRIDTKLVFPPTGASKSGGPIKLNAAWNKAREVSGLGIWEGEAKFRKFRPNFRWHDLRHTAASYLTMQGVSPLEISKILGHKTMAMVSRYSHLSPSHISTLGDKLAASMGLQ